MSRFQFLMNTLRDKVMRGVASVKEKAIVEYYDRTRGGRNTGKDDWGARFFDLPYSYSRMNDWIHYRQAEHEYEQALARDANLASRAVGYAGKKWLQDVHNGYTGSRDQWMKEHFRDISKEAYNATNYNATPGRGFFQPHKAQTPDEVYLHTQINNSFNGPKSIRYGGPREFTSLDIETDDYGRPITISALKQVYNKQTGQFETIDSFQRFYKSKNADLTQSTLVHGLTAKSLNKLRKQQGSDYGTVYSDKEEEALKNFLGSSVIVGHNIVDFDLPHLFKTPIGNQTIDTLTAARNEWVGKKNDLDTVFKRLFGRTMEQAGLSHHDSMSDVIASAMIASAMMKRKGETGKALRYVATHGGVHIAPKDSYLGSQVISGAYNEYQKIERYVDMADYSDKDIEDLMGAKQVFGKEYHEATGKYGIPEGFSVTGAAEGNANIDYDLMDTINLYTQAMADTVRQVKAISQSTGEWAQDMKAVADARNFSEMRSFRMAAARIQNPEKRMQYIRGAGYGDSVAAEIFKGTTDMAEAMASQRSNGMLRTAVWSAKREKRFSDLHHLMKAWDSDPEVAWNALQDVNEGMQKGRIIERARRRNQISDKQAAVLNTEAATKSFDDLSNSLDSVIEKNQKLNGIFRAMNSVPMYNWERLEHTLKGQIGGIAGAARGVMPDFAYSPFSRLVSANLNSWNESIAPVRYGIRAGTAIGSGLMSAGGTLMFSGVGGPAGLAMMGVGSAVNIGSQLFGNYHESKITQWGEGIQNNLNSIGFVQDMILMPFRLLKIAIDKVIKGLHIFAGVIKAISNLVSGSLSGLTQMGNPLSDFTGLGYGGYMGSTSADYASLLGKGTISGIMNDMAIQRTNMYAGYGINTNRMTAAARLGVFNNFYGDVYDEEEMFGDAIDKLHYRLSKEDKKKRKETYGLINQISPQMGAILQTMETLGVSSYKDLKRPAGMWGYSEDAYNNYRGRFQRAQWEYQYAGMQKETSLQRIGTAIWNGGAGTFGVSGRTLYNGFNQLLDAVADAAESGDWGKVGAQLKDIWDTITRGADGAWRAIKKTFGIDDDASFGDWVKRGLASIGVTILKGLRDHVVPAIYDLWDQIADIAIDKLTGIIEYLSTIRIDWNEFKKQVIDGKQSNIPWITSVGTDPGAYDAPLTAARSYSNLRKMGLYDDIFNAAGNMANDTNYKFRDVGFGMVMHNKSKELEIASDPSMAYTVPKQMQVLLESGAFKNVGAWSKYRPAGVKGDTPLDTPLNYTLRGMWSALYHNPESVQQLNKYLSEKLGATVNVGTIFPEEGVRTTEEAIQNWSDLLRMLNISDKYNVHQLAYTGQYGQFISGVDPRSSNKNRIMRNTFNSVKGIRGDLTNGTLNTAIDTLESIAYGTSGPAAKLDININQNDEKVADANYDGGKMKASSYNGFVQVEARDGIYQFQSNQSNRVTGY